MSINLVTSNIKSVPLMRQSFVNSDIKKVSTLGDVILWQEIKPDRYKAAVATLLPGNVWWNQNLATEAPISLKRSKWEVLASGTKLTHPGKAAITPNRYVSWVMARRVGSDKIVVFVNSHFISGAWSNRQPLTKKWRQVRWNHHFDVMDKMIERFVDAGYTVVGGGDWNKTSVPKFISNQRWLSSSGIDHLFTIEAVTGSTVTLNHLDSVAGLHTDHQPRVANVSFHQPKAYVKPSGVIPDFSDLLVLRSNGQLVTG